MYLFDYEKTGLEILQSCENRKEDGVVANTKIRKEWRVCVFTKTYISIVYIFL